MENLANNNTRNINNTTYFVRIDNIIDMCYLVNNIWFYFLFLLERKIKKYNYNGYKLQYCPHAYLPTYY